LFLFLFGLYFLYNGGERVCLRVHIFTLVSKLAQRCKACTLINWI